MCPAWSPASSGLSLCSCSWVLCTCLPGERRGSGWPVRVGWGLPEPAHLCPEHADPLTPSGGPGVLQAPLPPPPAAPQLGAGALWHQCLKNDLPFLTCLALDITRSEFLRVNTRPCGGCPLRGALWGPGDAGTGAETVRLAGYAACIFSVLGGRGGPGGAAHSSSLLRGLGCLGLHS